MDTLATAALASREGGKALIGTSSEGASASFAVFAGWQPDDILELIDAARAWVDEDTVDDALALIGTRGVRSFYVDHGRPHL